MKTWTIRKRIILNFGVIILLMALLGGFAWDRLESIKSQMESVEKDSLPGLFYIDRLQVAMADYESLMYRHLMVTNRTEIAELDSKIKTLSVEIESLLQKYERTVTGEKDLKLFKAIESTRTAYETIRGQILERSPQNEN